MTREEYLNGNHIDETAAHRRYYGQYVNAGTRAVVLRYIGREALLASTDPGLDDIPLGRWDSVVANKLLPLGTAEKLRANGDYLTLAGGVCILKEAALQVIEELRAKDAGGLNEPC